MYSILCNLNSKNFELLIKMKEKRKINGLHQGKIKEAGSYCSSAGVYCHGDRGSSVNHNQRTVNTNLTII